MKKTFTTIIATIMTLIMMTTSMSAYAAIGDIYDIKEYNANATYTVDDSYVICVPAEIYVGQENQIIIEDNNVTPNKSINVYITNLEDDGTLELTNVYDDTAIITAQFYDLNDEQVSNNSPSGSGWIGAFNGFDEQMTSFGFDVEPVSIPENAKAGTYTGIVDIRTDIVVQSE